MKIPFRLTACATLVVLTLLCAGTSFAADSASAGDSAAQVAQLSDMKGSGAAVDATSPDDFDDFDDLDDYGNTDSLVADPLSGWNKFWFYFNDGMYHGVFKPLAKGYNWAVPTKPRQWVRNFFTNMLYPVRFVNDLLQGKWDAAYMETSKFIVNTTGGLLGFADITAGRKRNWEPERPTADGFGQTLGKTGLGHGVYLVWPVIGPSSIRESVGWVGDSLLDPLSYGRFSFLEFVAIRGFKNVNQLSLELKGNEYEAITDGAIDKYAAVRDAYIRFRAKKVEE